MLEQDTFRYDTEFTGTSLRLVIWRTTLDLVQRHGAWSTGLGPGESQAALSNAYRDSGMYVGNPNFGDKGYWGYNVHNQYLQLLIDIGLGGAILFLLWLVLLAIIAVRGNNEILLTLVILFAGFSLTESTLEQQRGFMLFTFYGIALIQSMQNRDLSEQLN